MRQNYFTTLIFYLAVLFTSISFSQQVLITEVADPVDNYLNKFVEICNRGSEPVDITNWKLSLYKNGCYFPETAQIQQKVILKPNQCFVLAGRNNRITFQNCGNCYAAAAFCSLGNGNDAYVLRDSKSKVIDIYGQVGVNGTYRAWNYRDGIATRKGSVTTPNPVWCAAEWTIVRRCPNTKTTPCDDVNFDPCKIESLDYKYLCNKGVCDITLDYKAEEGTEIEASIDDKIFFEYKEGDIIKYARSNEANEEARVIIRDKNNPSCRKEISIPLKDCNVIVSNPEGEVLITEVASPKDYYYNRFVEVCNRSETEVNISGWALNSYYDGGRTPYTVEVPENTTLEPGECFVFANDRICLPTTLCKSSVLSPYVVSDGNDTYELVNKNKEVVDLYGEIGENSYYRDWGFNNSIATRNFDVKTPNKVWSASEWTIKKRSGSADATPCEDNKPFIVSWTGNFDEDWNNSRNWSTGTLPNSKSNVLIPAGLPRYPTVNTKQTVNSITLENNATLISNASITGRIEYKKTLNSDWYLTSSPLEGDNIENLLFNNRFAEGSRIDTGAAEYQNIGIATYQNDCSGWNYLEPCSTGDIIRGLGYSVKLKEAGDLLFSGFVNNDDVTLPVTKTAHGFNLVGNPYTSFINSAEFLANTASNLEEQTIWLWNGSEYETRVAADNYNISPTEGFFIKVKGNGTVTFKASDRIAPPPAQGNGLVAGRSAFSGNQRSELHITVKKEDKIRKTRLYYIDGATKGFDNGYDGTIFGGFESDFIAFTDLIEKDDNKYSVQSLPLKEIETTIVPLGLIAEAGKNITISARSLNLPEGMEVYLEDKVNNTFTNLSKKDYEVKLAKAAKGSGQFFVHTVSKKATDETIDENNLVISSVKDSKVTVSGLENNNAEISVYSLLAGNTKVLETSATNQESKEVELGKLPTGIYVVKVKSNSKEASKKIVLE